MGPINAGIDKKAIALSKLCLGMVRSKMMRPTGTIMAPPSPCTTREITNCVRVFERAQVKELSVNSTTAAINIFRAPKRSAAHPLTGTNMATAIK